MPSNLCTRNLPLSPLLQLLILNNLNPISIRIQQKRHILHPPIRKSLLPLNLQIIESLTRSIQIIHTNTDVSESLWLIITIVVLESLVALSSVVPCQLQDTLAAGLGVWSGWVGAVVVAEEVEVEFGVWVLGGAKELHAHDLLVEEQRAAGALDANHGVVHAVGLQVRGLAFLSLFDRFLSDNLDPVSVWIKDEGNAAHTSVCELLLELVAGILKTLACGLNVVDGDAGVTEALVRILVAVVDLVVWIVLSTVVV